jgi:A118 family predicted phage portal protein
MPLPANGTPWPPKALAAITPTLAEHAAWWAGDVAGLEKTYQSAAWRNRPSQYAGGVVGAVSRMWWGRPVLDGGAQATRKVHVPLAAEIVRASATLLYAEAPSFTVDNDQTQARLAELVDDGLLQVLAEGAEEGAALGGHFLQVVWDPEIEPSRPFLSTVAADAALPEFRWGRLVRVTFWHIVRTEGQQVWRHLELHELDEAGNGVIRHGLYQGTAADLGVRVPLTDDPSTTGLVTDRLVDGDMISTGSPGLAVVYVPNQRPSSWRNDPLGQHLGRSDLAGVESLMDALDEAYSSWMRDIRLGKARLLVNSSALDDLGPGQGAAFDTDREIFTPLNAPPSSSINAATIAQAEQPEIRFEAHRATCLALIERILAAAGYSPATFGLDNAGAAQTATEVKARQQLSFRTRDGKLRIIRPALSDLLHKLLHVDAAIFGTPITPERPQVEFPDGVQESLLSLAQTAQALRAAEAASTETLVRMLHPEWDAEQVDAEVAAILDEQAAAVPTLPDPTDPTLIDGATGPVDNATDVPTGA